MTKILIPSAEHGTIRVFAISRPIADMAHALKQQHKTAIASVLLGHEVSQDDIELFALSDLTGIGLHGYLAEGYDVDKDTLRQDFTRLEALDGYVLLVFSKVSAKGDVTLTPTHDLTLIGTYAEPKAKHIAPPIVTDASKLYSGVSQDPKAPQRSRAGSAFTAAAVLLTLLIIWWILR
ncbi:hypothetical protein [uncultured Sulfitobacter sp.]|uniref:hypothetical protein n=1 Tax=uncultured Sulfitobacter sp. TaxID=191468 RepID=UPI0026141181|nr:hypothetical protein [uncultured Sulfitobacter sp.]